jgi:hypothetical protein
LSTGGAEMMLLKVLRHISCDNFESAVLSLTDIGPVGVRIRDIGIPVQGLGMKPSRPNPVKLLALMDWLRQGRFDIVQTWMHHADPLGGWQRTLPAIFC